MAKRGSDFIQQGKGQECKHCRVETDSYKRVRTRDNVLRRGYYFMKYDKCLSCKKMFMIEKSKVYTKEFDLTS
jgi:hypothetical protein